MTLPASGAISLSAVNTELGLSATAPISLNDAQVRDLFAVSSTPGTTVAITSGYSKTSAFVVNVTTNQTNWNLRTHAISAGWNQSIKLRVNISSGVTIASNATGTPACTISGSFPGGLQVYNAGSILGMGGNGGNGGVSVTSGSVGGTGLSVASSCTVDNTGTIAGGGGGGGGGGPALFDDGSGGFTRFNGGGGGGGRTGTGSSAGGTGGTGSSAGNSGTTSAAGTGGAGASGAGGAGGVGGDYGSWGAAGATSSSGDSGGAGGSGGNAVSGNSFITWATTGTRLGTIS